jgi:uncharacterized protein YegP (UPF0339 family)
VKFTSLNERCPNCGRGITAHLWGYCQPFAPWARSFPQKEIMQKFPSTGTVEFYTDKNGQPRYRVRAKNGRIIAPLESYSSARAVKRGVEALRRALVEPRYVDLG